MIYRIPRHRIHTIGTVWGSKKNSEKADSQNTSNKDIQIQKTKFQMFTFRSTVKVFVDNSRKFIFYALVLTEKFCF